MDIYPYAVFIGIIAVGVFRLSSSNTQNRMPWICFLVVFTLGSWIDGRLASFRRVVPSLVEHLGVSLTAALRDGGYYAVEWVLTQNAHLVFAALLAMRCSKRNPRLRWHYWVTIVAIQAALFTAILLIRSAWWIDLVHFIFLVTVAEGIRMMRSTSASTVCGTSVFLAVLAVAFCQPQSYRPNWIGLISPVLQQIVNVGHTDLEVTRVLVYQFALVFALVAGFIAKAVFDSTGGSEIETNPQTDGSS